MQQIVPLELLACGEAGRICDVTGDEPLVNRLAEMGLRMGVEIRMVKTGSPCIVAVNNHRLSFRGDDAAVVMVEVCPEVQSA